MFYFIAPGVNYFQLKKCIDEVISRPPREEGITIEEIENEIRCSKTDLLDLEHPDFHQQFRQLIKNGMTKHRYIKEGKFYKMATFSSMKVHFTIFLSYKWVIVVFNIKPMFSVIIFYSKFF